MPIREQQRIVKSMKSDHYDYVRCTYCRKKVRVLKVTETRRKVARHNRRDYVECEGSGVLIVGTRPVSKV